MDIIVLAETPAKESYQEVGLSFYRQYAIGHNLTNEERDELAKGHRMRDMYSWINPVVTMSRRVDDRGGVLSYWEWTYYDAFESIEKASDSFGDSAYWFNANSKNPLHEAAVKKNNRRNELQAELKKLEVYRACDLKQTYQDRYDTELKARRLFSKAQNGTAPQSVITEIKQTVGDAYLAELKKVNDRIAEIEAELLKTL